MKKKTRKLTLAKETLGTLEGASAHRAAGGATVQKSCTCPTLDRTCPCSAEFACTAISCACTEAPNC